MRRVCLLTRYLVALSSGDVVVSTRSINVQKRAVNVLMMMMGP